MTEQTKLAFDVLRKLQSVNALRDIVLIGSWCQGHENEWLICQNAF